MNVNVSKLKKSRFLLNFYSKTNLNLFNSKLLNLANRRNSKEYDKFSKINTNSHLS